jgi:hypothetical protein
MAGNGGQCPPDTSFHVLRVGDRPMRGCYEKYFFEAVAQAFQSVPRKQVNCAQPGKAVPPILFSLIFFCSENAQWHRRLACASAD